MQDTKEYEVHIIAICRVNSRNIRGLKTDLLVRVVSRHFTNMLPEITHAAHRITLDNSNIRVKSFCAFSTRCIVINADCADLPTVLISASEKTLKNNETSLVASFTAKLIVIIDCNHIQA